jgi:hypothetical protein
MLFEFETRANIRAIWLLRGWVSAWPDTRGGTPVANNHADMRTSM